MKWLRMTWRQGCVISVVMLLTACGTQSVRQVAPPVTTANAEAQQAKRIATLSTRQQWSLQGRVALSNGRNGGSGHVEWRQDGPRYSLNLSAPVTRQSWRLSGDANAARLEGLSGGPREDASAETLLRDATGWVVPVAALASWVRGEADATLPPATLQFGPDGHLSQLQQAGWTIDYSDWRSQPGLGIDLPRRLNAYKSEAYKSQAHKSEASQGEARVRLVIDGWQEGAAAP